MAYVLQTVEYHTILLNNNHNQFLRRVKMVLYSTVHLVTTQEDYALIQQ